MSEGENYWTRRLGRRSMLRGGAVVGAGVAAAALIGCGDGDGNGGPGPDGTIANPTTPPDVEAQPGGTVIVGSQQGPNNASLDMSMDATGIENVVMAASFGDRLMIEDHDKNLLPGELSTGYEYSDDDLEVTYTIKPGAVFHDGTPVNAEAVAYWANRFRTATTLSQAKSYWGNSFEDVQVVDEYTTKWVYSNPTYLADTRLTRGYLSVPSMTAIESMGTETFKRNPVYSGPFKFTEWVQSSHVNFTQNDEYDWAAEPMLHTGPAYLDGINYVEIADAQSRADALESGSIDVMENVAPVHVDRFRNDNRFKLFEIVVQGGTWSLDPNMDLAPTDDIRVRQALAHAIDKNAINQVIYFGLETPTHRYLASPLFGSNPDQVDLYPYDPAKAVELLEGAGWTVGTDGIRVKDGQRLLIKWLTPFQAVAELVQAQWREVGVDTEITVIVQNTARDDRQRERVDHIVDGGVQVTSFINENPDVLRVLFHSFNLTPTGQSAAVFRGLRNEQLDSLLEQQAVLPSLSDERRELLYQAQDIIAEEAARLPIFEGHKFLAAKNDIQGIHLWEANFYWRSYDVWRGQA